MYVNPGEMDKKIEILKPSSAKNENGFSTGELIHVRKCFAKYSRKTGEGDKTAINVGETTVRFLIRYTQTTIDRNMIVKYAGKLYDIKDVNDIADEHRYIEIFCKGRDI